MANVIAEWNGRYPCLCHGKWSLIINDEDVSLYIPDELRCSPMNTFGTYQSWHFENWIEVFEDYQDGLKMDEWIEKNTYWLHRITKDEKILQEIYDAIQEEDFRECSCGGCI